MVVVVMAAPDALWTDGPIKMTHVGSGRSRLNLYVHPVLDGWAFAVMRYDYELRREIDIDVGRAATKAEAKQLAVDSARWIAKTEGWVT